MSAFEKLSGILDLQNHNIISEFQHSFRKGIKLNFLQRHNSSIIKIMRAAAFNNFLINNRPRWIDADFKLYKHSTAENLKRIGYINQQFADLAII